MSTAEGPGDVATSRHLPHENDGWKWCLQHHMVEDRSSATCALVVDKVWIHDVNLSAVKHCLFKDGCRCLLTETPVELPFQSMRVDDLTDIGGITTLSSSPYPFSVSTHFHEAIMQLHMVKSGSKRPYPVWSGHSPWRAIDAFLRV